MKKTTLLIFVISFLTFSLYSNAQCSYTLEMNDSFGDGWNGNTMDVLVNGEVVLDNVTFEFGSQETMLIPVENNDDVSTIWNGGGSYEEETSYRILNADGIEVGAGALTDIPEGTILATCPLCPAPSSISVANIGSNTAEISWIETGAATSWEVEIIPNGETASGVGETATSIPYTAVGLSEATTYDVYVRANCGAEELSNWTAPFTFTTTSPGYTCDNPIDISYVPYSVTDNTSNYGDDYENSDNPCGGFYLSGDDVVYAYTPSEDSCVDIALTNLDASYAGIHVFDSCPFINGNCVASDTNSSTEDRLLNSITLESGTTYYIVISTWATPQNVGYTLSIDNCPSCIAPEDLNASNTTSTTANLSWTDISSAEMWEVEVVLSGETPIGSGILTSDNPYQITNLSASSTYDFYVRTFCGNSDFSDWSGPSTFVTACDVVTPQYIQNFSDFLPNCWEEADNGDIDSGPLDIGSSGWDSTDVLGSFSAKINLYSSFKSDWLLSPQFDLSSGNSDIIVYVAVTDWLNSSPDQMGSDDYVQLLYTEDGGIVWNELYAWTASDALANTPTEFVFELPTTASNVQFGILASEGNIDDLQDYDFHVESIEITDPIASTSQSEIEGFYMYPNPVENTLFIQAAHMLNEIKVFNTLGQELISISPNVSTTEIDTSNLSQGSYIVRIKVGDKIDSHHLLKN